VNNKELLLELTGDPEFKEYKGRIIPPCNGRPQLWSRLENIGIRIIYPNGEVEYSAEINDWIDLKWVVAKCVFEDGCTSAEAQEQAIKNCIDYCLGANCEAPVFLGYL
jgi:hypothetical protein